MRNSGETPRKLDLIPKFLGEPHIVDKFQAVDINTEEDFKIAEYVGKVVYGLQI